MEFYTKDWTPSANEQFIELLFDVYTKVTPDAWAHLINAKHVPKNWRENAEYWRQYIKDTLNGYDYCEQHNPLDYI